MEHVILVVQLQLDATREADVAVWVHVPQPERADAATEAAGEHVLAGPPKAHAGSHRLRRARLGRAMRGIAVEWSCRVLLLNQAFS